MYFVLLRFTFSLHSPFTPRAGFLVSGYTRRLSRTHPHPAVVIHTIDSKSHGRNRPASSARAAEPRWWRAWSCACSLWSMVRAQQARKRALAARRRQAQFAAEHACIPVPCSALTIVRHKREEANGSVRRLRLHPQLAQRRVALCTALAAPALTGLWACFINQYHPPSGPHL